MQLEENTIYKGNNTLWKITHIGQLVIFYAKINIKGESLEPNDLDRCTDSSNFGTISRGWTELE